MTVQQSRTQWEATPHRLDGVDWLCTSCAHDGVEKTLGFIRRHAGDGLPRAYRWRFNKTDGRRKVEGVALCEEPTRCPRCKVERPTDSDTLDRVLSQYPADYAGPVLY